MSNTCSPYKTKTKFTIIAIFLFPQGLKNKVFGIFKEKT